MIDVHAREATYWEGRWVRGWIFRDRTLSLVRQDILAPLNRGGSGTDQPLKVRQSDNSEDAKMQAALAANRVAARRQVVVMAPITAIPVAVVSYLLIGLAAGIVALVIMTTCCVIGTSMVTRWQEQTSGG